MKHRPRYLVTAGNTREMIDRVRDWGNIFTGNTGYDIARALADAGGEVDLLTSNRPHLTEVAAACPRPRGVLRALGFTSHCELKGALAALVGLHRYDAVFMTAAVADYAPAKVYEVRSRTPGEGGCEIWSVRDVQAEKVSSSHHEIAVMGRRTEKLVDLFRTEWGHQRLLVKFKLEVAVSHERLVEIGDASRRASGADYLVANTLEMTTGPDAGAFLIGRGTCEWVQRKNLPYRLTRLAQVCGSKGGGMQEEVKGTVGCYVRAKNQPTGAVNGIFV